MWLRNFIRDVRDVGRMAMAQIEVASAAHKSQATHRLAIKEEIESWGIETFDDEYEAVAFVLDDNYGLPEGFEWTEPAVYLDEVTDEEDD